MPKSPKSVLPLPCVYSPELIALFAEHGHDAARSFLRLVHKREVPAWSALPEAHRSVFVSAATAALNCINARRGANVELAIAYASADLASSVLWPQMRQWPGRQFPNFADVFARAGLEAAVILHEDQRIAIVRAVLTEQEQGMKVRTLREQKKMTKKKA